MIAIVADSTVCATRDQARAMGLTVVPTGFTAGAQAYTERFMDDRGPEETRELTLQPDCKTSHAPVSAFQQAFEGLLAQGFYILCLTLNIFFNFFRHNKSLLHFSFFINKLFQPTF